MKARAPYRQGWLFQKFRHYFPKEIPHDTASRWEKRTRLLYIALGWQFLLFATYKSLIAPFEERQEKHKEAGIDVRDRNAPIYNVPQPSVYEYAGFTAKGTARPDQDTLIYKTTITEDGEEVVEVRSMKEHIESLPRPFIG